jgi:thioredoxin-like negative regulator of GroEL
MADDENPDVALTKQKDLPIVKVTTVADANALRRDERDRLSLLAFVSFDCNYSTNDAIPVIEQLCVQPEFEKVVFGLVDVNEAPEVAKSASIGALPSFQFFYDGAVVDQFTGNNSEKVKLMLKNCVVRRQEIITQREEAAAKAAAEAAEAAKAATEAAEAAKAAEAAAASELAAAEAN